MILKVQQCSFDTQSERPLLKSRKETRRKKVKDPCTRQSGAETRRIFHREEPPSACVFESPKRRVSESHRHQRGPTTRVQSLSETLKDRPIRSWKVPGKRRIVKSTLQIQQGTAPDSDSERSCSQVPQGPQVPQFFWKRISIDKHRD